MRGTLSYSGPENKEPVELDTRKQSGRDEENRGVRQLLREILLMNDYEGVAEGRAPENIFLPREFLIYERPEQRIKGISIFNETPKK